MFICLLSSQDSVFCPLKILSSEFGKTDKFRMFRQFRQISQRDRGAQPVFSWGIPALVEEMETRIDFATADDLETMADLLAELFTLESDFQPQRERQLAGLRLILDDPGIGRLFVLRVDGRAAGMANALLTVSTAEGRRVVLLEDVIVAAKHRGRGLGQRLVRHVVAWATANGLPRITVLADKDNAPALAFYERMGFTHSAMRTLRKSIPPNT
ncbi:MAG: GNAT family N-acetyltransferase [Candidatus Accumulibacter sp.]|jgi:GNAT superfamily N-acetyltransferase|nr:GNAT family N-acetyltransferase [Accumulibacter sp.]